MSVFDLHSSGGGRMTILGDNCTRDPPSSPDTGNWCIWDGNKSLSLFSFHMPTSKTLISLFSMEDAGPRSADCFELVTRESESIVKGDNRCREHINTNQQCKLQHCTAVYHNASQWRRCHGVVTCG